MVLQHRLHRRDELRVGAAAAAKDPDAQRQIVGHLRGKLFRRDRVFPGQRVGQTGVGFYKDGQRGVLLQLLGQRQDLLRPQRAVKADEVGAQSLDYRRHRRHAAAGESAAGCLKGHADHQRQRFAQGFTALLDREDAGLDLVQVGHRLQHHQVHPGGNACPHLLAEQLIGLCKGEGAGRLHQLAQRPDVQRDQGAVRLRCTDRINGLPCVLDGGGDDLSGGMSAGLQLLAAGAEGVGVQDVGSGQQIFPMHLGDDFGMGEV